MANISSLSSVTTAALALSNLVLVTPESELGYQPQVTPTKDGNPLQQPPTFLFNIEGENKVTLNSDITDHYIEDNTTVQDQIALPPAIVAVQGFIGELNDVVPRELQLLKTIADKLTTVTGYVPELSETAINAYNQAKFIYDNVKNVLNSAVAAWSSIAGEAIQNKQQIAFTQLQGYRDTRTLFTIQTPWAIYNNMAIMSMVATQDAETRIVTEFDLTFKQIRFAQTITERAQLIGIANFQNRLFFQGQSTTDLGASTPPLSPQSFGSRYEQVVG